MKPVSPIRELFRQYGAPRSILLCAMVGVPLVAYSLLLARLAANIGWPENYGFTCRRKCMFVDMWNSYKLLTGGTGPELMLFALIWFLPIIVVAFSVTVVARRRMKRRHDRIRPMADD